MFRTILCAVIVATLLLLPTAASARVLTQKQVVDRSQDREWRTIDANNLLVMQLEGDRQVLIELAPGWAPKHVANIKQLVQQQYFDGTSVYRVQDNFVAQWGDPDAGKKGKAVPMGKAKTELPAEFTRSTDEKFEFTLLPDGDLYAPEAGFSGSMPAARNRMAGKAWLVHCYGMVGVARSTDPTSGSGNTLYVPIGQAPRQLDHQLAIVGRVIEGMQWLAALPRGPEPMGVYKDPGKRTTITSVRLASALPADKRPSRQVLRSDSISFMRLLDAVRNRQDDFYRFPVGHVGVCNVPLPVRKTRP